MSAAPPPSPLIAPDLRRQLQQRFEEAQRLSGAPQSDFRRIHDLLAECVRSDPGSVFYLDALLANLRRWRPQQPWLHKWFGIRSAPSRAADSALREAPQRLLYALSDSQLLRELADAAGTCNFDEVELRYSELAVAGAPADLASVRRLALVLTRQGRFDQAALAWQDVLKAAPDHAEAAAAIVDLDLPTVQRLEDAQRELADAQAAGGPLLALLERREELQIEQAEQRWLAASRRAAADPHPQAQALAGRMAAERDRVWIEVLHVRCERLPGDWRLRLRLAERLKDSGNFSGAIQRLDEAWRLQPDAAPVLVMLGECWQHLRQFAKALEFYRQAIPAAINAQGHDPVAPDDDLKLAYYRAGVLEAALNQPAAAREHFTLVLALDRYFRDARERLDKLPKN